MKNKINNNMENVIVKLEDAAYFTDNIEKLLLVLQDAFSDGPEANETFAGSIAAVIELIELHESNLKRIIDQVYGIKENLIAIDKI